VDNLELRFQDIKGPDSLEMWKENRLFSSGILTQLIDSFLLQRIVEITSALYTFCQTSLIFHIQKKQPGLRTFVSIHVLSWQPFSVS